MPKASELLNKGKLHALVYGPANKGKTRFIGTAAQAGPLYVLNFEGNNIVSLAYAGFDADYDTITTYELLMAKLAELGSKCEYTTIGVDSLTRMYDVIMEGVLRMKGRDVPSQADWGLAHTRLQIIIKKIFDLNTHVIATALQTISRDDMLGSIVGGVALPGKMSEEIPPLFNLTLRLETKPGKEGAVIYVARSKPTSIFPAGDKFNRLDTEEAPDFQVILNKIKKGAST